MLRNILFNLLCTFASIVVNRYKRPRKYQNKNILVIGGTSGLGLSLALKLSNHNYVTVTGRSTFDVTYLPLRFIRMDVTLGCTDLEEYDVVFYCAGYAVAKYFVDLEWDEVMREFDVNYFGALRMLRTLAGCDRHTSTRDAGAQDESLFSAAVRVGRRGDVITRADTHAGHITKPRDVVLIGTPLTFFSLPGYAAYSPSKSALYNLFSTVRPELSKMKINLYFYILSTTKTRGYDTENITKPEFTKQIEMWTDETCVDERSDRLLNGMAWSNVVTSDCLVELMRGNMECGIRGIVIGWVGSIVLFFYRRYLNYLFMHEK